jgi:peptidoglycan hydrolase-like protein with peptidoglycan-binding domain
MSLNSPRFKNNPRLQQAAQNSPPIKTMEKGQAVAILQQAFLDLGYSMPKSTKNGSPDGDFGSETYNVVVAFQRKYGLSVDGAVGLQTMTKLDQLLPTGGGAGPAPAPAPPPPVPGVPYNVPGVKTVLAQPSPMGCWATVYCMMRCWKEQNSYSIRDAVLKVGQKWATQYDKSFPPTMQGMPPGDFGSFLRDARMSHQPMANLPISDWARLLRQHGLLWIGASVDVHPNTGLHSRILEGITGNGQPESTSMKIIDPDGGRRYTEAFMVFLAKYESGIRSVSGEYFQIRHF